MQEIKSTTRDAIVDFFLDFRAYITEVFGSDPDDATLDWNSVGACIHYFGEDRTIQFRLWERSEGHLGIPDMTLIIIRISLRGAQEVIHAEMTAKQRRGWTEPTLHPLAETDRQVARVGSDKPSPLLRGPPLRRRRLPATPHRPSPRLPHRLHPPLIPSVNAPIIF